MNVCNSKVFIVHGEEAAQDSLPHLFGSCGYSVETCSSPAELLGRYSSEQPACLILDFGTAAVSGLAIQEQLRSKAVALPVIVLSANVEVAIAVRAMKTGAVDFILKPFKKKDLLDRTRAALAMAWLNFEEERERCRFEEGLGRLTPREREILLHVLAGKANKVIAEDLNISQKTVEVHRYHLMHKMEATSAIQLATLAGRFWRSLRNDPAVQTVNRAA